MGYSKCLIDTIILHKKASIFLNCSDCFDHGKIFSIVSILVLFSSTVREISMDMDKNTEQLKNSFWCMEARILFNIKGLFT